MALWVIRILFLSLSTIGGYRYRALERALDWQRYRVLQSMGAVLAVASALALAFSGAGVYALLIGPLARAAAEQADARTDDVEPVVAAEEGAGRGGEAGAGLREQRPDFKKMLQLAKVAGVVRFRGRAEVAHHQLDH